MVQGFARNEAGDFPGCVVRGPGSVWGRHIAVEDRPTHLHTPFSHSPSSPLPGRTLADGSSLRWQTDRLESIGRAGRSPGGGPIGG